MFIYIYIYIKVMCLITKNLVIPSFYKDFVNIQDVINDLVNKEEGETYRHNIIIV
jgi:hypothetical protein